MGWFMAGRYKLTTVTENGAAELANRYGDKIRMNALAPGFSLAEQNKNLLTKPGGGYTESGDMAIKHTPQKFWSS